MFVSDAADFARTEADGKKVLAPHLAAIQGVQARPADPLLRAVQVRGPGGAGGHLVARRGHRPRAQVLRLCGGDLTLAAEACDKARRAGLAPTDRHAALVCEAEPGAGFADPLVAGDKAAAMAAASGPGRPRPGPGSACWPPG